MCVIRGCDDGCVLDKHVPCGCCVVLFRYVLFECAVLEMHGYAPRQGRCCHTNVAGSMRSTTLMWADILIYHIGAFQRPCRGRAVAHG